MRSHQQVIRAPDAGSSRALRSGVEMNTLPRFMNVDDLSVLRRAGMSPEGRREVLLQTPRQVGKDYDFNFDAETTERIFCSKLVCLAHGDVDWPTSRILGRHTISPDDIARRSLDGAPFAIVSIYHDGKPVESPLPAMRSFLKQTETNGG